MRQFITIVSLVLGAWMLTPAPQAGAADWDKALQDYKVKAPKTPKKDKGGGGVPELDPSGAGAAMVLLLGGVAYLASRRRKDDLA